jgi:hypothetical protein
MGEFFQDTNIPLDPPSKGDQGGCVSSRFAEVVGTDS